MCFLSIRTVLTLDFLDCKINRLCTTTVFCPLAPVVCPFRTCSYSQLFHTLTSQRNRGQTMDKPWINRGQTVEPLFISMERMFIAVERLFFAVDWGTLKNAKLQAPNFGSAYLKWKKVKKTTKWWCTKKRENKPSSLINRLCQNSCKINRLWKSRVN